MAQKMQARYIDDLDGTGAEGAVGFGLDGTGDEIDLTAGQARALRQALARSGHAARRAGGGTRRPARSRGGARASGRNTTEVRDWATAHGIDVKDRGRVPAELVIKFTAATGK